MSVLVPDLKVFENVQEKISRFKFNKVCDINYCQTLRGLTDEQSKEFIKNLLILNLMSYNKRYNEEDDIKLQELTIGTLENGTRAKKTPKKS